MSRPTDTGSVSETIYADLERFQYDELRYDYALLKYLESLGRMFQPVDDLARDTDQGPGWSHIVDLNRVPDEGVRWLGQFVGAKPPIDASIAYARQYVAAKPEWQRGTVAAMVASIQRYLTGNQTVTIRERDTSPYHFSVYTYEAETPVAEWRAVNLSPNPSFETTDMSNVGPYGQDAVSRVARPNAFTTADGDWCIRAVHPYVNGSAAHQMGVTLTTPVGSVTPGKTYSCSLRAYIDQAINNNTNLGGSFALYWVDSVGNLMANPITMAGSDWWRTTGEKYFFIEGAVAPVGAVRANIFMLGYNMQTPYQGPTGTISWYADAVQFEENTKATPFVTGTRQAGSANILKAILAQKPAGLQFGYSVVGGWTYEALLAQNADYQSVFTKYNTYGGLLSNAPGT